MQYACIYVEGMNVQERKFNEFTVCYSRYASFKMTKQKIDRKEIK